MSDLEELLDSRMHFMRLILVYVVEHEVTEGRREAAERVDGKYLDCGVEVLEDLEGGEEDAEPIPLFLRHVKP